MHIAVLPNFFFLHFTLLIIIILHRGSGGLPYYLQSVSSSPFRSLVSNISCTSTEDKLCNCTIVKQKHCLKNCEAAVGLKCFGNEVHNYIHIKIHIICSVHKLMNLNNIEIRTVLPGGLD